MVDPIQASSKNPLPDFQTVKGSHDPLPPASVELRNRVDAASSEKTSTADGENFASYLERTSIINLERANRGHEYNVTDDLQESSIYRKPGETTPL